LDEAKKDVDARDKRGHDGVQLRSYHFVVAGLDAATHVFFG